jgi:hypothetical protein
MPHKPSVDVIQAVSDRIVLVSNSRTFPPAPRPIGESHFFIFLFSGDCRSRFEPFIWLPQECKVQVRDWETEGERSIHSELHKFAHFTECSQDITRLMQRALGIEGYTTDIEPQGSRLQFREHLKGCIHQSR